MSSSTALLPKDRKKDDHPIFLRVCHSPWVSIGQKALVGLRFLTAMYLLISFLMIVNYEIKRNNHGWLTCFEFSNVVYFLQMLYQWIAFIWTFMHLHYPHHASQIPSYCTRFQKLLSPPRTHPTTKNRTFFSIFYTAAVTYPHVSTLIHWAILVPKGESTIPGDEILGHGWYTEFFVFNKFAVNSFIALVEVYFFCSIKRMTPIWAHVTGLSVLSLLYAGWAGVGYIVTDKYAYYFFDHKKIGWECVAGAIVAFVALTIIFFSFVYGLTGIREKCTKKSEDKSYSRLPQ